jgi:di/tricarboxylate transporter
MEIANDYTLLPYLHFIQSIMDFIKAFPLLQIKNWQLSLGPHAQLLWVLVLLLLAIALFMRNKPRMDAVGVLMMAALPFTGAITMNEALMGFSDPNIVLIGALFVLGEGLVRTGVAMRIGDWLRTKAGGSEIKLLLMLMVVVALMGSIMSSTAVVAIFIPVVMRICERTGLSPSRLMMPLSIAALVSGMFTLIATAPNLVVNAALESSGKKGFEFFSVTPIGLAVLAAGLLYMLVARHWIPQRKSNTPHQPIRPSFQQWIEKYDLAKREYRFRVLPDSTLLNKKLQNLGLRNQGINLLAIERKKGKQVQVLKPTAETQLMAGDVLLLDVTTAPEDMSHKAAAQGLEMLNLLPDQHYLTDYLQDLGMTEAIVSPDSAFVGSTILDSEIRSTSGLTVVGLSRGRKVITDDFLSTTIKAGDILLVTGFWKDILRVKEEKKNLVMLHIPVEFDEVLPVANKALYAMGVLALVIVTMVAGWLPNVQAVLLGCLLLGLLGIMNMNSAYQSISWKSLILIVGMMPFSLALQRTGGIEMAADTLVALLGNGAPRLALSAIFVVTALLGLFVSNTATAVLMAPVAISMAEEMAVSPYPFAMTVAIAASAAFMTPVSSPVNTLVVAPGNYKFGDFIKIGTPFTLIVLAICVWLIPLLFPF